MTYLFRVQFKILSICYLAVTILLFSCEKEREIPAIVINYFQPLEGQTYKLIGNISGDTLLLQTSFFINAIINEKFTNINYQEKIILRKYNEKLSRLITITSDENGEFNLKGLSDVNYSNGNYDDPHSYTKKMTIS